MVNRKDMLWPYSKSTALLFIPNSILLSVIILSITYKYTSWPDAASRNMVTVAVLIISLIPLLLVLLDFAAKRGAILDIKGVKLDFSQADVVSDITGLPDNIGEPGALLTDTTPMRIMTTLERATDNEVVRVDLKAGTAWWVTRLLALCAGAERAGSPKALVFTGVKENISGSYLGWAEPSVLLKAMLNDNQDYHMTYRKSMRIAKQVAMFGASELLPNISMSNQHPSLPNQHLVLNYDVERYATTEEERDYAGLGEAAFEQILMDQLALSYENPPDRLTLGRMGQLFEHCLYKDTIDLAWPSEKQLAVLLESHVPYIALVKDKRFQRLLKKEAGERIILKQLFQQAQQSTQTT